MFASYPINSAILFMKNEYLKTLKCPLRTVKPFQNHSDNMKMILRQNKKTFTICTFIHQLCYFFVLKSEECFFLTPYNNNQQLYLGSKIQSALTFSFLLLFLFHFLLLRSNSTGTFYCYFKSKQGLF